MGEDDDDKEVDVSVVYGEVPSVMPGERVQTDPGGRNARVMYVGQVPGMPAGYWVGVQYDEKVGKNDGAAGGRRYFRCPPGHGGFLRPPKIKKLSEVVAKQVEEEAIKEERERKKLLAAGRVREANQMINNEETGQSGQGLESRVRARVTDLLDRRGSVHARSPSSMRRR